MFRVHEHLEIELDHGTPWVVTIGGKGHYGGKDIPPHVIASVIAERQFALDRAEQMTRWLAAAQMGEWKR